MPLPQLDPVPAATEVLLQASGITKSFPGVKALAGVQLTVRRGRLNALLGENGAGKSTMMNILAGVFPPDDGLIQLDGKPVAFKNTREAQRAGISIIFQELNLVPDLSVAENIFLGREPLDRFGWVDFRRMNAEATRLLRELEAEVDPRRPVSQLRVGEQQLVEIAKAMSLAARVIIMDEPTSAITENEVATLFRQIRRLKAAGVGLIYITHKLDELPEIADDITVFRDGKFVCEQPFASVTRDAMIRLMVGRDLADLFPKTPVPPGDEVLRVENISLPHPNRAGDYVVKDVSFAVRRGEVLGIFGLLGAGRTEMLQALFGLHPGAAGGQIAINGKPVRINSPADAIAAGLALAPEDRKGEGLVLGMSVEHNLTLASLPQFERLGWLCPGREQVVAADYVGRLKIKTPTLETPVINLSGGNQQKVVLAKWLATGPKVLLLDEPTRGIDIHAKKEIYTLIDELAQKGLAVVMVSSELPELLGIADRILVLSQGRKTAEFSRADATEEKIMRAALPVRAQADS